MSDTSTLGKRFLGSRHGIFAAEAASGVPAFDFGCNRWSRDRAAIAIDASKRQTWRADVPGSCPQCDLRHTFRPY